MLLYFVDKVWIMDLGRIERYKKALECVRHHQLRDAFELYYSVFLPQRMKSTVEFNTFYRYQLSSYLEKKRNYILALAEGDMVSDLIEMTYSSVISDIEKSDIKISYKGRINILESVEIIFPCHCATGDKANGLSVSF